MYPQSERDKIYVKVHPSPRQLAVEQMEFYAFAHFTVNTFTGKNLFSTPPSWTRTSGWTP